MKSIEVSERFAYYLAENGEKSLMQCHIAWLNVSELCRKLGMDQDIYYNMTGEQRVLKFIRELHDAAQEKNQEMTIRDEFAMSPGDDFLSFNSIEDMADYMGVDTPRSLDELMKLAAKANASVRYIFADAMMEERNNER